MKNLISRNKFYLLVLVQMFVVIMAGIVFIDANGSISTTAMAIDTQKQNNVKARVQDSQIQNSSRLDNDQLQQEMLEYKKYVREHNKVDYKYYVITASALNVREAADINSKKLGIYRQNDVVQVISQEGDWVKTTEGYIHSNFISQLNGVGADVNLAKMDKSQVVLSRGGNVDFNFNLNVGQPTNASVEQFRQIVAGTSLEGIEDYVFNVEQQQGINGFFVIAVARLESGNGTSLIARKKNNLFGLNATGGDTFRNALSFSSKGESVEAFGELIKNNYVNKGLDTPRKINSVYCPPNKEWASMVTSIMTEEYHKIK